jgi:hypothetical protein
MNYLKLILFGLFSFILTGCEEVIDIDIKDSDTKIVIQSLFTDQKDRHTVKITKTVKFYDSNTFPEVSGAIVTIKDDVGNVFLLSETSPGIYQTDSVQGEAGRTYTLDVVAEGKTYSASSRMPAKIVYDSLVYKYNPGDFFQTEGYYSTCYFTDPVGAGDYYKLTFTVNGKPYLFVDETTGDESEDSQFYLVDAKYSDGRSIAYEFWPSPLKLNDTVDVALMRINFETYDYFLTLSSIINDGGFNPAPANPNTNISNGAMGYWAAVSYETRRVVIQ